MNGAVPGHDSSLIEFDRDDVQPLRFPLTIKMKRILERVRLI
jgi:hypothetical protein